MSTRGFTSVILDVDSTLCGIEGIDWLALRCGGGVSARVRALTERAMAGDISLDTVYGERLSLVRPSWQAVAELADAYQAGLSPRAEDVVRRMEGAGRRVVLVSGGIREAIVPVAVQIGIPERNVHAVSVRFDLQGEYIDFDRQSPLATSTGKRTVAEMLSLPGRVLAVGDGVTDLAMRPAVDAFAAYTGFVRRDSVAELADFTIDSFEELAELVLA